MFSVDSTVTAETETEARTSKRRWRVSNIGAEQDEGITSPEIKGQAEDTHQNKTTASPRPQYLSPVTRRPSKGLVLSLVYRASGWLSEERCLLPASECVCSGPSVAF